MKKPNILIVTGTRAEYGILTPVIHAISQSKKLNLQLLATGMHLQKRFGHTLNAITFPIDAKVPMYKPNDTPAQSLARGTLNLANAFQKLKPDLIMVLGDRLEILAAANAALACQIPLAHLHGGETAPGIWDEQIRHALTKIANLHFPATKKAATRIQQMGEHPNTIHQVGAPALDTATQFLKSQISNLKSSSAILLLHPSSPNKQLEYQRTTQLLTALKKSELPFTTLGPNNDPGHQGILRAYKSANIKVQMSLTQQNFFHLLATASVLIGNSSAGILETASFALPVINLGDRQKGRERNPNVIDLPWESNPAGIQSAITRALSKPFQRKLAPRKNLYGDGQAAPRILKILESLPFPHPTTKQFHDH